MAQGKTERARGRGEGRRCKPSYNMKEDSTAGWGMGTSQFCGRPEAEGVGAEESGRQEERWAEEPSSEHTVYFETNIWSGVPARSQHQRVGVRVLEGHLVQFSQGAVTYLRHLLTRGRSKSITLSGNVSAEKP